MRNRRIMESYGAVYKRGVWKLNGYLLGGGASVIYGEDMARCLLRCEFPGLLALRINAGPTPLAEFVIISREGV